MDMVGVGVEARYVCACVGMSATEVTYVVSPIREAVRQQYSTATAVVVCGVVRAEQE